MNSALNTGIDMSDANLHPGIVDPGIDVQMAVRPSSLPLLLILGMGLLGAVLFWWFHYPGVAGLLVLVMAFEALLGIRRQRFAPVALCGQGMRWWLVNQGGEMIGPFWLDERTRHGASWMTLHLRDVEKRQQRLLLGRWNMAPDAWRLLKWRVLEQAQQLQKARSA